MKFLSLEIENFRQHKSITVDLSGDRGDFVVIEGKNGAGKTNFLNAITWCLYGKTMEEKDRLSKTLLNQSAVIGLENGKSADVTVSLTVALENNLKAVVTRVANFSLEGKDLIGRQSRFEVLTEDKTLAGFQSEPDPVEWVEANFPSRFSPYFLFDGEKLDRFFRDTESKYIKNAVLEIAQVDLLERLVAHLKAVSGEMLSEVATASGVAGTELSDSLAEKKKIVAAKIQEKSDNEEDRITLRGILASIQKQMGDLSAISTNFQRQKEYAEKAALSANRAKRLTEELASWAISNAPFILVKDGFDAIKDAVQDAHNRGTLPPAWRPEALAGLIASGNCICGCGLENGSRARQSLEELISQHEETSSIGAELQSLSSTIRAIESGAKSSRKLADSLVAQIGEAQSEHEHYSKLHKSVTQKLVGHSDTQVSELADQQQRAQDTLEKKNTSIGKLESEINTLNNEIASIELKIEKEASKNQRAKDALKESRFAKSLHKAAEALFEQLNNAVRDQVASSLDRQFKEMIWKKDFFERVAIDEDFKISVFNNRGFEILKDLSAGERECLAFAFSLTLSQVARFSFPMVVDTPMGRLSPEVQQYVSRVLVDATSSRNGEPAHQIILLMTETEYNAEVAEILSQRNPRVFEIDFDVETSESKMSEVN